MVCEDQREQCGEDSGEDSGRASARQSNHSDRSRFRGPPERKWLSGRWRWRRPRREHLLVERELTQFSRKRAASSAEGGHGEHSVDWNASAEQPGHGGQNFERYFSALGEDITDGNARDNACELNPVLVQHARAQRESDRRRPAVQGAGGKYSTGGLARLVVTERSDITDEQEVERYLKVHQGVQARKAQHSNAAQAKLENEACQLQVLRCKRGVSDSVADQALQRRLSQVQAARGAKREVDGCRGEEADV